MPFYHVYGDGRLHKQAVCLLNTFYLFFPLLCGHLTGYIICCMNDISYLAAVVQNRYITYLPIPLYKTTILVRNIITLHRQTMLLFMQQYFRKRGANFFFTRTSRIVRVCWKGFEYAFS